MRRRRGIALVTILLISAVLMTIVSVGLKLGSDGVLFVSNVHKRNVALAAAEAGIYEAMAAVQNDKSFHGHLQGTLADSGSTYRCEVENELFSNRVVRVIATGEFGGTRRTLKAELEPDSGGFDGLSVNGVVGVFQRSYVNAIASSDNPLMRPGNAHTNYGSGANAGYVGAEARSNGAALLHATGGLSAQGDFDSSLERVSQGETTGQTKPQYRLDSTQMESGGSFTTATSLSPGTLTGNTEITNDIEVTGKVIVPKGVKLVVRGDARFLGGISGEGEVVVHGDAVVRTDAVYDPSIEEGVKLFVDDSVVVTHPSATIDEHGVDEGTFNQVGDFFAQMPLEASDQLSTNLPISAPRGGDFFTWFDTQMTSPSPEFQLWYEGDNTSINPGISEDTKSWLQNSRPIHAQIAAWAAD